MEIPHFSWQTGLSAVRGKLLLNGFIGSNLYKFLFPRKMLIFQNTRRVHAVVYSTRIAARKVGVPHIAAVGHQVAAFGRRHDKV